MIFFRCVAAGTETCPLYPARNVHQTVQLSANATERFVSVLVPHTSSQDGSQVANSIQAAYTMTDDKETYELTLSLMLDGIEITAKIESYNKQSPAVTKWSVERK
jgi:hypothetical protein